MRGAEAMEPFFFDCLTDAQLWSLFDIGVLQGCPLPTEVYARLARIAPDHGCCLFTWPAGMDPPSLQEIVPGWAAQGEEASVHRHSAHPETPVRVDRMHSAIEAFRGRLDTDSYSEDHRIYVIATTPHLGLRPGPYLQPRARDLTAMSLAELEAYLDDVLQLNEGGELDAAPSSDSRWGRA